jgi:hypothetical protein
MNYTISRYNNLTLERKDQFFKFCYECSKETDQPAANNMWEDDWFNKSHTLPYILEIDNRFKYPNGEFFILSTDDEIVGCSGVYQSTFDKNICIAGVRTWIKPEHRHSSINREYFFPTQKQWALEHNFKIISLTFNSYNKNMIEIFKRKRIGEKLNRLETRQPKHLFYSNFNQVPFSVVVQNTEQWLIYEKLSDYTFDWDTIRYK